MTRGRSLRLTYLLIALAAVLTLAACEVITGRPVDCEPAVDTLRFTPGDSTPLVIPPARCQEKS